MNVNTVKCRREARLNLQGRFDFASHAQFKHACDQALEDHDVEELVLDMTAVEYLDSSALGMLLLLRDRVAAARKAVAIENCQGTVRQVLGIANFEKLFAIR
ncbi:MAG TPA: STAS domain-containing protein [Burkholderiales bacterium]|nr:STAS domain-containing protein [Burkholderiales bacterium]